MPEINEVEEPKHYEIHLVDNVRSVYPLASKTISTDVVDSLSVSDIKYTHISREILENIEIVDTTVLANMIRLLDSIETKDDTTLAQCIPLMDSLLVEDSKSQEISRLFIESLNPRERVSTALTKLISVRDSMEFWDNDINHEQGKWVPNNNCIDISVNINTSITLDMRMRC